MELSPGSAMVLHSKDSPFLRDILGGHFAKPIITGGHRPQRFLSPPAVQLVQEVV